MEKRYRVSHFLPNKETIVLAVLSNYERAQSYFFHYVMTLNHNQMNLPGDGLNPSNMFSVEPYGSHPCQEWARSGDQKQEIFMERESYQHDSFKYEEFAGTIRMAYRRFITDEYEIMDDEEYENHWCLNEDPDLLR